MEIGIILIGLFGNIEFLINIIQLIKHLTVYSTMKIIGSEENHEKIIFDLLKMIENSKLELEENTNGERSFIETK